jgi:hypothetical protein
VGIRSLCHEYPPLGGGVGVGAQLLSSRTAPVRKHGWRELLVDPRNAVSRSLGSQDSLRPGPVAKGRSGQGRDALRRLAYPTLLRHKGCHARRAERLQRRLEPRALRQGALAIPA